MATRQEIQVGHSLTYFTWKAIHRHWVVCHFAQEVHPVTGEPLLYKDPEAELPSLTPWPVDKLLTEVTKAMQSITLFISRVNGFVGKADSKLVEEGLKEYGLLPTDIATDIQTVDESKISFLADKNLVADKEKLTILGSEKLIATWQIDKVSKHPVKRPVAIKLINGAHDSLDALSYELRGINESSGDVEVLEDSDLRQRIIDRAYVARVEATASGHPDTSQILQVASWVTTNKDALFLDIADHIDFNLPKLPSIRRHWAE